MELQSPSVVDLIWIVFTLAELWDLEESRGTSFILPMSLQKIALSFLYLLAKKMHIGRLMMNMIQ